MERSTSKDPEVHSLRAKCQQLEKERKELDTQKKRLESKLLTMQKQLGIEEQLVKQLKERRATEIKTLKKDYMDTFETAMNLLKVRVQVEMSQSLRRHKEQLKMNFRSDLLKLTRKNCQLTNLLRYIQQWQQLEKDCEIKLKRHTFCCARKQVQQGNSFASCQHNPQRDSDYCYSREETVQSSPTSTTATDPRFNSLRSQFQKQIAKLLDELKEREDGIEELSKNVQQGMTDQTKKTTKTKLLSTPLQSLLSSQKSTIPSGSFCKNISEKRNVSRFTSSEKPSRSAKQKVEETSSHADSKPAAIAKSVRNSVLSCSCGCADFSIPCLKPICSNNNNNSLGPVRNKNHRGTRESRRSPYDTHLAVSLGRRRRCNAVSSSLSSSAYLLHSSLPSEKEEASTKSSLDSEKTCGGGGIMRELDIPHATSIDCSQSFYNQHHNPYQSHNGGHHHPQQHIHHQYHQQCGGSGLLETLPEAESEEEEEECESISPVAGKSEDMFRMTRSPLVSSATPSSSSPSSTSVSPSNDSNSQSQFPPDFTSLLETSFGRAGKLQVAKSLEDFGILQQCEAQENRKISVLESIIRQLRDELKECKDQNELLEFRLLEMQELSASPVRSHQVVVEADEEEEVEDETEPKILVGDDVDGSSESTKQVVSCLPNSTDPDYEGGNGHANVTESRSSCSDCSESLSLQESGIFDSQSTEDSPLSNVCRLTISRELVSLTFQIEELLRRFNEGVDETGSGSPGIVDSLCVSTRRGKTSHDLASELQSCRQRIQVFERRLAAMSDGNYIQGLEEKVNFLLNENRRLEDERAEIEEAENDNRLMCQRLEERLGQLQKKKLVLQNRLAAEKKCIEQLRVQVLQMQEREEDLCSQISRLESLLQNYEQRNFELEESCIEMKCSVQFVIHSVPIFALCYFGTLLRTVPFQSRASSLGLLLSLPSSIGRYLHFTDTEGSSCTEGNALSPTSTFSASVIPVAPSRKHKLREIAGSTEAEIEKEGDDIEPKLKKLKRILDKNGITCFCDCANCGNSANDRSKEGLVSVEAQTGEELWKHLVEKIFTDQKNEWHKAEKVLLKKIEILECDIDKCQEIFDQERANLIKMYEQKLAQKESQLKETQACRNEKRDLQEKWNCLIQELEQFALYLGKNLTESADQEEVMSKECKKYDANAPALPPSTYVKTLEEGEIATGITKAMTTPSIDEKEIRLPSFISATIIESPCDSAVESRHDDLEQKTRLISCLQSSLREHLSTFEKREKHLLDEIERLTREIRENSKGHIEESEHQGNMVAYLSQENERLKSLFQDHEKCWGDLQQLQEEHEKLKLEVGNIVTLRKKLEETQKTETDMRDRVEELERTESQLKSQINSLEKKEQKGLEKIQQLRDEIQFLRTKCCQLQDDIDGRVTRETKYKNEIQALTVKLKESSLELEEKESQLESNETALQAQITKLKTQLGELHQAFADTECSNGMLREEVSYLERTVEEAIAKAVQSENTVSALSHELKQKDMTIEELQRKLERLTTSESIAGDVIALTSSPSLASSSSTAALASSSVSSSMNPYDLAIFNKHDGGLHGVARDVEEVVTLLQRCSQCEKLGTKLMDIVERLIVLIQILKTSQVTDGHLHDHGDSLSRCESEEVLNPCISNQEITDVSSATRGKDNGDDAASKRNEEEAILEDALSETTAVEESCLSENNVMGKTSGDEPSSFLASSSSPAGLEFRVLRKIGSDSLLVSWSKPEPQQVHGYEIAVNGEIHLKIPKPNRQKVILFGLNFDEPLRLTLRCSGGQLVDESTITYIN